ncbi:DUF3157 family protein [Vibrio hepatarius]|uniref:DUF3157 family protein n=1 Tax=Vibrio hepatarius TaxID=171383 RepID=UPI001C092B98|nr:DUF3157 family protein [Vibrio hepatarius]MBU2897626.1 DUF3157 family protein [Vibrio hepatarius]
MYRFLGLFALLAASTAIADQTVTLDDGRQVILNDDFTWQYMANTTSAQTEIKATEKTQLASIPLIGKTVGSMVRLDSMRPTMQLSDSGIDVLLGVPSYDNQTLIIPTSITNQSLNSVILVEAEIEVSTASKKVLSKKHIKIWQSIKRMPDTYLRPQQVEQGKNIELDVIKQDQYFVTARITSLITR